MSSSTGAAGGAGTGSAGQRTYEAFLTKLGAQFKTWKRRYFVINEQGIVEYFASENRKDKKGTIDVNNAEIRMVDQHEYERTNVFTVTPAHGDRTYVLMADNPSERDTWIQILSLYGNGPITITTKVSDKAKDLLYGGSKRNSDKINDKLGENKQVLDKFRDLQKAYQKLGVFDDQKSEVRPIHEKLDIPEKSTTTTSNTSSSVPEESPRPLYVSDKAKDILYGGQKHEQNKVYDKLGLNKQTMDKFGDDPKAYKTLGLFDDSHTSHAHKRYNSSNQIIAPIRYIKTGILYKEGKNVRNVKQRFFLLSNDSLLYYKDENENVPYGEIPLSYGATVNATPESDIDIGKAFTVTPLHPKNKRTYLLFASTNEERDEWISSINQVLREYTTIIDTDSRVPLTSYTHSRILSGWLRKQGHIVKSWKRRFFVLHDDYLSYFKDENDTTPQGLSEGKKPLGRLFLKGCTITREILENEPYVFSITQSGNDRKYLLIASSKQELDEWWDVLVAITERTGGDNASWLQRYEIEEKDDSSDSEVDTIDTSEYIHPNAMKEGWIMKQGENNTSLKRRYLILADDTLKYYEHIPSVSDILNGKKIEKGSIDVIGAQLSRESIESCGKKYAFSIQPLNSRRKYILIGQSDKTVDAWLLALKNAIIQQQNKQMNPTSVKEGYMHRLVGKEWIRQYYLLANTNMLYAYASHLSLAKGTKHENAIYLHDASVSYVPADTYERPLVFIIGNRGEDARGWICSADSSQEMQSWVDAIMKHA